MDNELLYWLVEYAKVLFAYGFVLFIWPLVVFRKYLKEKSITFRFCFCATAQVIVINTVVLMLGLVHILNKWTMWIVFYGIFIWSLREYFEPTKERRKRIRYLITGTLGWKHYFWVTRNNLLIFLRKKWKIFKKFYGKHLIEYTVLIVTVIYGMLYFSYGAFCDYSYGFGDMYVHHSWIYGLVEGKIFSAGVYPEAMHCVIYSMHTLLGVDIYSCMLFLAGIHIAVILLSAYCLMKEVFHWRFSSIFVLILFLILDVVCIDEVFSMSRLQWTLPQEYGFHTMYICALYLILYLKSYKQSKFKNVELKACWDDNLFLFMMALAASIAIHFYVTIMAFFLCFAFAVFKLKSIFHKRHFVPLVTAVLCGLLIAAIPMGGALASGIKFQGSIGWAMNVIKGVDAGVGRAQNVTTQETLNEGAGDSNSDTNEEHSVNSTDNAVSNKVSGNNTVQESVTEGTLQNSTQIAEPSVPAKSSFESFVEKISVLGEKIWTVFIDKMKGIYANGYVTLYKAERARWIIGFSCLVVVLYVLYRLIYIIRHRILKRPVRSENLFVEYIPVVFSTFLFMLLYAAPLIGLPELIAGARLCTTAQMLILMVIIMPIDMIFSLFTWNSREDFLEKWSLAISVGLVAMVWFSGSYHGYLYYELTRYNAAVSITNEIMDALPENTYTIVSPTDEIYQVIQNGRHEELLTFVRSMVKDNYTLPTEYIFIYVEKSPMKYAHSHFFAGPDWIALEKYQDFYTYDFSVCPEVCSSKISSDAAQQSLVYYSSLSQSYSKLESRIIIESKAYEWCERFGELYPNELKVYYEDEDFVCYYIRQNPQYLYNLVIE